MMFYNERGVKVHLTADNISFVFVEGKTRKYHEKVYM